MASFVLIPAAGGVAWYWHRVVPLLEASGHGAVAVDLPGHDKRFGLSSYADRVIDVIARRPAILVAQSLAGLGRRSCAHAFAYACSFSSTR